MYETTSSDYTCVLNMMSVECWKDNVEKEVLFLRINFSSLLPKSIRSETMKFSSGKSF